MNYCLYEKLYSRAGNGVRSWCNQLCWWRNLVDFRGRCRFVALFIFPSDGGTDSQACWK